MFGVARGPRMAVKSEEGRQRALARGLPSAHGLPAASMIPCAATGHSDDLARLASSQTTPAHVSICMCLELLLLALVRL